LVFEVFLFFSDRLWRLDFHEVLQRSSLSSEEEEDKDNDASMRESLDELPELEDDELSLCG
jgi:hypothetical protein